MIKAKLKKNQLKAYLIKHGGDQVKCSVCDKNFTTTFSLRRHMAGAHENVKHQCRTCKAVFTDKDVLKQHVSGLHNQEYRYVFSVQVCGAKYRWRTSLARHMKSKYIQ